MVALGQGAERGAHFRVICFIADAQHLIRIELGERSEFGGQRDDQFFLGARQFIAVGVRDLTGFRGRAQAWHAARASADRGNRAGALLSYGTRRWAEGFPRGRPVRRDGRNGRGCNRRCGGGTRLQLLRSQRSFDQPHRALRNRVQLDIDTGTTAAHAAFRNAFGDDAVEHDHRFAGQREIDPDHRADRWRLTRFEKHRRTREIAFVDGLQLLPRSAAQLNTQGGRSHSPNEYRSPVAATDRAGRGLFSTLRRTYTSPS